MRARFYILVPIILLDASLQVRAGKTVSPGQYTINHIQNVCLTKDDTWYGTTFNFGGRWDPVGADHSVAELWGNYRVHDASGRHKANTTMTIVSGSVLGVNWYDWFDDRSYGTFLFNVFEFVKTQCDPPFTGQNTHPATE